MKILIFGGSGLLGSALRSYFLKNKYNVFTTSNRNKADFLINKLSKEKFKKIIQKIRPNIIINCIALTDVDKCEKKISSSILLNANIVNLIISSIQEVKLKSHFIQISTDHVYDKSPSQKKNFEDDVSLTNIYSITKYLGEKISINYNKSTVLRTNFFGKSLIKSKISYSDWIIKNLKNNKKFEVPGNVYFSPVNLKYIGFIINKIIKKKIYGTYNLGSSNALSKYEFAKKIAKLKKLKVNLIKKRKNNFANNRPTGMAMSSRKIEKALKIQVPTIYDFLQDI